MNDNENITAPSLPIQGDFEIISRAGSSVYVVYDKLCCRRAVIKRTDTGGNEAPLLGKINSEGVPALYGSFEKDGYAYIITEYIGGMTLREYTEKKGGIPEKEAARMICRLCDILSELHSMDPPVIHRDIKPDNIIITPDNKVCLIDFGIARRYSGSALRDTVIMGTPSYAPPEQYGCGQTDIRSDIYSAGVLLKEITKGKKLSPATKRVIKKCTAFDPKDRFPNAQSLKRALSESSRRGKLAALTAAALTVLLAAAFFIFSAAPSPQEELYTFRDKAIEEEVKQMLGKTEITRADLRLIQRISLVGSRRNSDWTHLDAFGGDINANGSIIKDYGNVHVLDDLRDMPNLTTVILCNQQITDLSPLRGLNIRKLALHGNMIYDLSPLRECHLLKELVISSNPAEDLSPLEGLECLKSLNVGATYIYSLDSISEIKNLEELEWCDCPRLRDISALSRMRGLKSLKVSPVTHDLCGELENMQLERLGLDLYGNFSTEVISSMTGLRELSLCRGENCSLKGIENLGELEFLDLYGTELNSPDEDIKALSRLTRLSSLNIGETGINNFDALTDIPALRRLYCDKSRYGEITRAFENKRNVIVSPV